MTPPTYPARPVNGGPLDKALPKSGAWFYEPKYNGWRVLVHAPTGNCFNRKGEPLSIESAFSHALGMLRDLCLDADGKPGRLINGHALEWFDCEGLERRHGLGQGSLIVLDWIRSGRFEARRRDLAEVGIPVLDIYEKPGPKTLYRPYSVIEPTQVWHDLRRANIMLGCEFYEGIVAKRDDSFYPIQLRSADLEFPFWMKHRWQF